MAHPYAGQAQSSQKARLKRLGATAGKAHGSSSMYKKHSYPSAGTQREYTISGSSAKSRPDRYAAGGGVKSKRRPHPTTNIIISHAGGRGGAGGGGGSPQPGGPVPVPVPVNRPVPVPVGAGGPPQFAGPAPAVVGGPPPVARPPIPAGPPPAAVRPPMPMGAPPPVRPPGMKKGGSVKLAIGGSAAPKGYKGYPNSPTTEEGARDAVSAHKRGGGVKKLQFGGGSGGLGGVPAAGSQGQGLVGLLGSAAPGRGPMPAQRGTPTITGANQIPAQPLTVPQPKLASSFLQRPAPGTTASFKKGGNVHSDEAQDKKLIKSMIAKEEKKEKYAAGGLVKTPVSNSSGGGATGKARLKKTGAAKSVPDKTEKGSPRPGNNPAPRGMSGSSYHQWGKGVS